MNPELFNINDLKKTSQESLDSAIDAKVSFILNALAKRVKEESKKGKNIAYVYKINNVEREFGEENIVITYQTPLFGKHNGKIRNSAYATRLIDALKSHGFAVIIEPKLSSSGKRTVRYLEADIWVSW